MSKSKSVTYEQIVKWNPCGFHDEDDGRNYTPERICGLMAGREALSARDIVELDIPAEDRVWALLRREFLSERQMHELACRFAELVVHLSDDYRSRKAIAAKRAWLRGEIGDRQLAAAGDAARDAARFATGSAARDAAWAARFAAGFLARDARTVAGSVAWAIRCTEAADLVAAWEWQLEEVLRMIDGAATGD